MALIRDGTGGSEGTLQRLLTETQMERYSRQTRLKEIGLRGQARLLQSRVAIVGAGGLGSPVAIYLATAGVGRIGLIDGDEVDLSNLHRQPLHFQHDIGRPKVRSGRRHLEDLNPDVQVVEHAERLTSENAMQILGQYDVVVNGTDNFPTRYLVNDACMILKKPLVDASILMWEGHLSVYIPGSGCYRCLYPQPPAPGLIPSCAEAGIVGAVAGIMGTMQALEVVKILLGVEGVMRDRTLIMDALNGSFRTFRRRRRADCPVCGDSPSIHELIDYQLFCGLPAAAPARVQSAAAAQPAPTVAHTWDISIDTAAAWYQDPSVTWIDVREPVEYAEVSIPGSHSISHGDLAAIMAHTPRTGVSVFICATGRRSALTVERLRNAGYDQTYNLAGGMLRWENYGLPVNREE